MRAVFTLAVCTLPVVACVNGSTMAEAVVPWKCDVEVISSPIYVVSNWQFWCDQQDRLWARIALNFGENTDAYHQRQAVVTIVSEDQGATWRESDEPWPGPRDDRSVLPDGMIVETGTHYWQRQPRSEIKALQEEGFYVWDLGEKADYCAVLYGMWVRRSTDGGETWEAFPVHEQFGFFARFAVNAPPHQRLLADGTIVTFAHGYRPEGRTRASDLGGLNHPFILRSKDAGREWQMIQMADGSLSCPRGEFIANSLRT